MSKSMDTKNTTLRMTATYTERKQEVGLGRRLKENFSFCWSEYGQRLVLSILGVENIYITFNFSKCLKYFINKKPQLAVMVAGHNIYQVRDASRCTYRVS